MFNDAAEASWNEEHFYVALMQAVHKLPAQKETFINTFKLEGKGLS